MYAISFPFFLIKKRAEFLDGVMPVLNFPYLHKEVLKGMFSGK